MKLKMKLLFAFLWLQLQYAKSENILYISTIASPSHHIWNSIFAEALVQNGHNLTMIGPEENIKNVHNFSYISLHGVYDKLSETLDLNEMSDMNALSALKTFDDWCLYHCKLHLEAKNVDVLLDYPKKFTFDLIIIDLTLGPCFLPLIHRFNYPPTVGVTAFLLPPYLSFIFGNEITPSYQPHYELIYDTDMSFIQRFWNFLFTYLDLVLKTKRQFIYARKYGEKIFGNDVPSLEKLQRHVSILLANTDPVLNFAQPLPPNIIPVGGLHTRKPKKLPAELQDLLDNAKNGVILFSLGTNIRSDLLDANVQHALLEAFKERPELVIWKFESDVKSLPPNVIVKKWLSQNDILGHPNVKLFIGHGGALSTQEAIFHGVPMIAIPFIADQLMNAKMIVKKKIGIKVDKNLITKIYIRDNLNEILNNRVYEENMKKLSNAFKKRMETPLERGLYWIQYILENGNCEFLNPPSRDMAWYQIMNLDVILCIIVLLSIVIYSASIFMGRIVHSMSVRRKKKIQ